MFFVVLGTCIVVAVVVIIGTDHLPAWAALVLRIAAFATAVVVMRRLAKRFGRAPGST
jgi:hypothetical protein